VEKTSQREDSTRSKRLGAFDRLMDEFSSTQEAVAERTGKDRSTVETQLRLLKLEPTIQEWIEEGKLRWAWPGFVAVADLNFGCVTRSPSRVD